MRINHLGQPLASESHALAACHCMHTRKTCASAVVAFCFTTTFKPYYSSIFGTTLVALSSLQTHAWSLWSFTCFRICCSHLCTLTFVLLYVSSHICALICVLLLSFHVMPCSICSSLHYLGSLAGVIFFFFLKTCFGGAVPLGITCFDVISFHLM